MANEINGTTGDDVLSGGSTDDLFFPSTGDDVANGGTGNDEFVYEDGQDLYDGGAGTDNLNMNYDGAGLQASLADLAGNIAFAAGADYDFDIDTDTMGASSPSGLSIVNIETITLSDAVIDLDTDGVWSVGSVLGSDQSD